MSTPEFALELQDENAEIFPESLISPGLNKLMYGIMKDAELPTSVHVDNEEIKIAYWRLAGMDPEENIYAYPVLEGKPPGPTGKVGKMPPDTVVRDERAMKEYGEMEGQTNRYTVFPVCFRTLEELIELAHEKERDMEAIRQKLQEFLDGSHQI